MAQSQEITDAPIGEILDFMEKELEKYPGSLFFLKWTCPACGERVTANDPNGYHAGGYKHEEKTDGSPCGAFYTGIRFGLLAIYAFQRKE